MEIKNRIDKTWYKKPWAVYIEGAVILVTTAIKLFLNVPVFLTVILGIIALAAFVLLGISLLTKDSAQADKVFKGSVEDLIIQNRAYKAVDSIMTMAYGATVVLGVFLDSMFLMIAGLVLLIMNTVGVILLKRYYKKK